jgi:hypothetical protein
MWYIIMFVVGCLVGGTIMFFVLHNNIKYINIDKMAQEELKSLMKKIKAKI